MDDWQKDFFKILDSVGFEVEQLFHNLGGAIDIWADDLNETLNQMSEDFQNAIGTDLNEYFEELFEPLVDIYGEISEINFEDSPTDTDSFINPKIEATSHNHPACIGCVNYHGRVYNGSLLVCGMHPYGREDQSCPDWEGKNS